MTNYNEKKNKFPKDSIRIGKTLIELRHEIVSK